MTVAVSPRYVIISPVKDEERHIELTLRSVTRQTLKPVLWVIVDDGSTDGTAQIVRQYAVDYPFIKLLVHPNAGVRNTGSAEVTAFYRGYDAIGDVDADFIVKLDGDLSFEPDYFKKLLDRLVSDSSLGIASGVYLEMDKTGSWKPVGMPSYHAFGACKVVRRRCFDQIGGFASRPGWDTADEIRAWNLGWKSVHFKDLEVRHHKPEGSGMGFLRTSRMHGEIHYVTGGDPFFLIFKVLHRARLRPFLFGALALFFGYAEAVAKQKPLLVTPPEAAAYRQLLRWRLWNLVKNPLGSTEYRT
jgi:glycosyltransferase involved in cell wall biosynthesis